MIASESPRVFSSRAVVSASGPDAALMIVYCSRYLERRSRRTAASTCGSSSATSTTGLFNSHSGAFAVRDGQSDAKIRPARLRLDSDLAVIVTNQASCDVEA